MAGQLVALPVRRRWRPAHTWPHWLRLLAGGGAGAERNDPPTPVSATATAERVAFEAFFRAHERAVFGYLWRMTSDEQSAYDLSQETFLRAWQHFARIQKYEHPEAWLFRVATNLAISHNRARRGPVASAAPLSEESAPARSDPAWQIGERENVRAILDTLPTRQRAALLLRDVYGLSGEELATVLGVSLAAARMLASRAREHFRTVYEREEHAEGRA